jgi:hypothetical protein
LNISVVFRSNVYFDGFIAVTVSNEALSFDDKNFESLFIWPIFFDHRVLCFHPDYICFLRAPIGLLRPSFFAIQFESNNFIIVFYFDVPRAAGTAEEVWKVT